MMPICGARLERQAAPDMHFDNRNTQSDAGLGAQLPHTWGIQIGVTGLDVVDRNDVSSIVF
ncbi:hypothetical protein DXH78_09875 [Undibacter mobilis]|uniref:Uncharacterized protein n=1 Tax=Undibacter mobilis TaxID=2292256 RepID=A0A371BBQ4_9BRAD|nr:hypothetical protein DXH78_09875 [Undibacter mobilis]